MSDVTEVVERVARVLCNHFCAGNHSWDDLTDEDAERRGDHNRDSYRAIARAAIEAMREPTEEMEDAARGAWLWYAGLPHDNKWTLGQQNKAGGYKLSLTDSEASALHLPKHVMGRICWRTQIDKALGK